MQKVCFVCLQPSRLKCSRCDAIQYCGKECQKNDWKVHKHNCQDNNNNINTEVNNSMVLFKKAKNYFNQGNYHRSEKVFMKLLEPSLKSQYTPKFQAQCLVSLSAVLYNQNKFAEATKIAQESLDTYRSKLGSSDSDILDCMNNLAASYIKLGKFDKAYELLNECIETSTIMNGENHAYTIGYQSYLGFAYDEDGRHDEAQKLLHKCLASLTKNDDIQWKIISRLASIYESKCQYKEAGKLYEECLERSLLMKGENHPLTIDIKNNLANVNEMQYKPVDQIEAIREELLEKSIVINGKDCINTFCVMSCLAVCYSNQGRLDEAEQLYKECLENSISILGRDHNDTLTTMSYLARNFYRQDRYDESINLNQECLERRTIILGENHSNTLGTTCINKIGVAYEMLGNFDEALVYYKDCYDIRCIVLVRYRLS